MALYFDNNDFVKNPLHMRRNTELEMQGSALRVELVLSGFFSAQIPPRTSALKIPPSYIRAFR